ncbi:hypothetical protein [Actinoplanes sp. NPDC020271]|uniref:hypothetical protein n=1 Tax=Actinoplanes sp. NPDC020271 TaxID=3363896 RepID=UPI003792CBC3
MSNVDRELLAYFLRIDRDEAESGHRVSPFLALVVEHLPEDLAAVFSRFGEVLLQTRPAIALFGDYSGADGSSRFLVDRWWRDPSARRRLLAEAGPAHDRRRRYRHAELGMLTLHRQLLVDPVERQLLLIFTAVPGSVSDDKLRRL